MKFTPSKKKYLKANGFRFVQRYFSKVMIHRLRACENFLKYKTASISYIKQRNNRTSFLRISDEISNRKKLDTKNLNDN